MNFLRLNDPTYGSTYQNGHNILFYNMMLVSVYLYFFMNLASMFIRKVMSFLMNFCQILELMSYSIKCT